MPGREVQYADIRVGMVIGEAVMDADRVLLAVGTVVRPTTLNLLRSRGVKRIKVLDPLEFDAEQRAQAVRVLRETAEAAAESIFAKVRDRTVVPMPLVNRVADSVMEAVALAPNLLFTLSFARATSPTLISHSFNTLVLSILIGKHLRLADKELRELGVGALLHDLGMLFIASEIPDKPGPLDASERKTLELHAEAGFEEAARMGTIPPAAVEGIYQHHERLDGSGYPGGLAGDLVGPVARVVAVADVYDALVSKRPWREAYPEFRAVRSILPDGGSKFDSVVVSAFLSVVNLFPVGTPITLSDGRPARVVEPGRNLFRPIVRLAGPNGETLDLSDPKEFRLSVEAVSVSEVGAS